MDELQDRIPIDKIPSLYTALNRAIRILSKRLYFLESDLITGELSVPIYAQESYTASTIAFVSGLDGAADTITDSANQFIVEGFNAGMGIYSDCPGNINPVYIEAVSAGTITLRKRDKVTAQAAGANYTLTSENSCGYLPDDFWGLLDKPYVVGQRGPLLPLPNQETLLRYMGTTGLNTGSPSYYKLMSDKLGIVPATASDIILSGYYYKKPAKITDMEDYLPYSELFDDVIIEYLLAALGDGAKGVAGLAAMLESAVDLVCLKRGQKAPTRLPGGFNYGDMAT